MLAEILARVSREALQADHLDAILQRIVDCLARDLPVAIASIILLDDDGTHFVHEVAAGDLPLDSPAGASWPVTLGAAGRCARSGQAQLIDDVASDPDYVPGNPAVRSEYLVPIRHRDRLHGVLNIESTDAGFFSSWVRTVFDAVADQIAGAIHLARTAEALEQANRRLRALSLVDGLTGVANRRGFDEHLAEVWERQAQARRPLALLMVDADCFKELNDSLGHQCGDECLRELARLCSRAAAGADEMVARYGGEELALLLPGRAARQAAEIAERLRREVEAATMPHPQSPVADWVTVSIGVCALDPWTASGSYALVSGADRALYAAKAAGRNRVAVYGVDGRSSLVPPR